MNLDYVVACLEFWSSQLEFLLYFECTGLKVELVALIVYENII